MTNQGIVDFKTLKRAKKGIDSAWKEVRIALLGDHATQFIKEALIGYGAINKLNYTIYEAEYSQIDQEILDADSELYHFKPEIVIITNSVYKLEQSFHYSKNQNSFANSFLDKVEGWLEALKNNASAKVILSTFPELPDSVFGNFATKVSSSFLYQLRVLNLELMKLSAQNGNLFLCDVAALYGVYGQTTAKSAQMYINADMIFSLDFIPVFAKQINDIILALRGKFNKCLILDLDNTTWGGIIGDDGLENIKIGDLGIGKAFSKLQTWAKALKERGVILCICSKNDEANAKEPFEKHPDMVLRLEDISVFVANWENKASNIRNIQEILNIGFDSMVFLDDNPFERNLVRQELPEVIVPELPEDPAEYLDYLLTLNLFETASFSENDKDRTKQYQAEAERVSSVAKFANIDDYLASLEMVSEVKQVDNFSLPRVAQLTQRSNQFNLRTQRYTDEDLTKMLASGNYLATSFTLVDKYGDNGLISAIVLKKEKDYMFVDTWIMSCRVLKRTMEPFVLNSIVEIAKKEGYSKLVGEYLPTAKNGMVKDHYKNFGFVENDGKWELSLSSFEPLKCFIQAK
ncbi:MAG: HAD-IIIC family phosphatase [Flavobacteriales bacterium]